MIALASAACEWRTSEHAEFYVNGQLRVTEPRRDWDGMVHGPWVWWARDGTLLYTETFDGTEYTRTGFYEHGEKVRELSDPELEQELRRLRRFVDEGRRMRERR